MKLTLRTILALAGISLTISASASKLTAPVSEGAPCRLEGERAYVSKGSDDDVFVCTAGVWKYLYTRTPSDNED